MGTCGVVSGVCIECCLDLCCVIEQCLLCVPDSTTYCELFKKELANQRGSDGRVARGKIAQNTFFLAPYQYSTCTD